MAAARREEGLIDPPRFRAAHTSTRPLLAHRDISLQCNGLSAFGALSHVVRPCEFMSSRPSEF
jgi:hypothetical protein